MDQVYIKTEDLNKWIKRNLPNKDVVSVEDLLDAIETLDDEVEHLNDVIEDLKNDIEDNYRPISYKEQIAYSERDFI